MASKKFAVCPDGHQINGTLETIYGVAEASVTMASTGEVMVEHNGYTEIDWQ